MTFQGVLVEMAMHPEILATDMAPTLHQKCKFSTALHLAEILHLVLIKTEQAAWPPSHFKLLLILQGTSDWFKAKIVATGGHLDATKIVELSLTQVAEILKGDIHLIEDLVHNDPPAKAEETTVMMTITSMARTNINPIPYIPAGAEDEDWDADLDPAESSLERAHQLYQADWGGNIQTDDHTMPHDYYLGPPEPQPGSYPGGEQLTSRNTIYAELQDSLNHSGKGRSHSPRES